MTATGLRQLSFVVGVLCASVWALYVAYRAAVLAEGGSLFLFWVAGSIVAGLFGWGLTQALARRMDRLR